MKFEAESLAALPGLRHGFFGRKGGVSHGPFQSLNVSLRNADEATNALENRKRVVEAIGLGGASLSIARQVHGAVCHEVTEPFDPKQPPEADALVTSQPGLVLGVTTADCAPILLADAAAGVVAAAHAGWRGAKDGIIEATVDATLALGARLDDLQAAIGPCIAGTSYEVGPEFEGQFLADDSDNSRFFQDTLSGARHFDLSAYCTMRLERLGLLAIEALDLDTFADDEHFFSYRRTSKAGEKHFGLQVAAIALAPET